MPSEPAKSCGNCNTKQDLNTECCAMCLLFDKDEFDKPVCFYKNWEPIVPDCGVVGDNTLCKPFCPQCEPIDPPRINCCECVEFSFALNICRLYFQHTYCTNGEYYKPKLIAPDVADDLVKQAQESQPVQKKDEYSKWCVGTDGVCKNISNSSCVKCILGYESWCGGKGFERRAG